MRYLLLALASLQFSATPIAAARPNILIITVDDMSADSIGAFGCALRDTTPTIDRLAAEGMRFEHAHVQAANCMPSRNVMWSGRYPHNNRVEGFYQVRDADYPVLTDLMKSAGYFTAIRGKVGHSTPYAPYAWDLDLDAYSAPNGDRAHPKDVASYKKSTEQGIRSAQEAGRPFCLMINVADPHKPFYGQGGGGRDVADPHVPSRVYSPEETPVPGFLFDDPAVRKELSHYYSTVRRADDCVAGVLEALDASGEAERTVVVFLSDHGMPLPFAKTQLYHHSTRTPLIVRWPGVTAAGSVDNRHMVSAVDLLPTLLDVAGLAHPESLDGRSFAPLLRSEAQEDRDHVFKVYNENSGGSRDPMRAVQTRRFLYIFNPWSDGERVMRSATQGTPTYRRMKELAAADPQIAARLELLDHRVIEELYETATDPDCLNNLINEPSHEGDRRMLQSLLESSMTESSDPMLEVFRARDDANVREDYMARVESESASRGQRKKARTERRKAAGRPARRQE
jgi:N-sulfoglucosamine sulfohydrolase